MKSSLRTKQLVLKKLKYKSWKDNVPLSTMLNKVILISQRSSLSTDADKTRPSPGSEVALCKWWESLLWNAHTSLSQTTGILNCMRDWTLGLITSSLFVFYFTIVIKFQLNKWIQKESPRNCFYSVRLHVVGFLDMK